MNKRVLIVGGGSIGKKHRSIVKKNREVSHVQIIGQRKFDAAVENCDTHDIKIMMQELIGFIPNIAIIAGPAPSHIRTASIFISMNIHTIIEKPLANNVAEIENFEKILDTRDVYVTIGYNLRFLHSLQYFKKSIESGTAGKILSIRAEVGQYLPDWRPGTDYRKSVSANSSLGGGVLLELSHEIDYLQWIFGHAKSVSAVACNVSELSIDVEDVAHFVLFMNRKKEHRDLIASVSLDFIRKDACRICTAVGEHSSLRWDGIADTVSIYDSSKNQWNILFQGKCSRLESYERAFQHFIDCIDGNAELDVTPEDGRSVLNVIDAIRKSSAQQCCKSSIEMYSR